MLPKRVRPSHPLRSSFCPCQPAFPLPTRGQSAPSSASVANSASVYCEQNDGKAVIKTAVDGGQFGVAYFVGPQDTTGRLKSELFSGASAKSATSK